MVSMVTGWGWACFCFLFLFLFWRRHVSYLCYMLETVIWHPEWHLDWLEFCWLYLILEYMWCMLDFGSSCAGYPEGLHSTFLGR
jgi:hypothetical protein